MVTEILMIYKLWFFPSHICAQCEMAAWRVCTLVLSNHLMETSDTRFELRTSTTTAGSYLWYRIKCQTLFLQPLHVI